VFQNSHPHSDWRGDHSRLPVAARAITKMFSYVLGVWIAVSIVPPISAGQAQANPSGRTQREVGTIRGRVVSADTGVAIRRARILVSGGDLRQPRVAITDADGRYEIRELTAGSYSVTASKAGFVTVSFGQRRAFDKGTPVQLRQQELLDKVDVGLPRASVIVGRVLDEFGDPIMDAQVRAYHFQYVQGHRQMVPLGRISTSNDIGEFRIFGLGPGDYSVSATINVNSNGVDGDDHMAFAPTFFPGTPNPSEAEKFRVAIGQTLPAGDLRLSQTKSGSITGALVDGSGQRLSGGGVMFMRVGDHASTQASVQVKADGTFTIPNLPVGSYSLSGMHPTLGSFPLMGHLQVTIAGDVADADIYLNEPARGRGRIVFPAGATQLPPAALIRIRALPAHAEDRFGVGGGLGQTNTDYSVDITALPGRAILRLSTPIAGWNLKAVRWRGQTVTDEGIDFRAATAEGDIEIELTNEFAELSGTVQGKGGRSAPDYSLIVFPQDRTQWDASSRFITTARPDQNGSFAIKQLPPGQYFLAALDYVESGAELDPDFLEQLREVATRISVTGNEKKELSLKLIETANK
jgi:uncharacterized protein (DUF2141 family)